MIKRDYTIIRVVISIITVIAVIALIVNRYPEWSVIALAVSAIAINLYLKYRGNRAPLKRTSR
ncbi:MAG TPA: hypothetical protein VKC66_02610 [Xanthobacteraceae bacterium]|nr:hypothetical protein [Xanthobacteraceae bacterium]